MDDHANRGGLVVGGYVLACVIWPFTACGRCNGTGCHRSPGGKAWRSSRGCRGSGKRVRLGRCSTKHSAAGTATGDQAARPDVAGTSPKVAHLTRAQQRIAELFADRHRIEQAAAWLRTEAWQQSYAGLREKDRCFMIAMMFDSIALQLDRLPAGMREEAVRIADWMLGHRGI